MKSVLLAGILFLLTPILAQAAVAPAFQDIKLPTQQMIEKQSWAAPWGGYSTYLLNGNAGPTSAAAVTVSSGFSTATLDVARNITIQASGPNYNRQLGGTITVTGTNYLNHTITEDFVIPLGSSTAVTGTKAFKSITSVAFPASLEATPYDVNWYVGMGVKLGIKRCMVDAASMLHGAADGVKEATAPTIVADVDEVEKNTAQFNTAPNHSKNFDLYFWQNFRCTR